MSAHLHRCLDSVLYEGCPDDTEILVVNDGSTDDSKSIIDLYAQRFPNHLRSLHKENGGWGSCINTAVQMAQGRYFRVLDSDDCFDSKQYEEYMTVLRRVDTDILVTSHKEIYPDGEIEITVPSAITDCVMSLEEYISRDDAIFRLSGSTYKLELLSGVSFSPRYYADLEYNAMPLLSAKTIYFAKQVVYHYYKNRDEQSTSKYSYIKNKRNFLKVVQNLISFFLRIDINKKSKLYGFFLNDFTKILIFLYNLFLSKEYESNKEDAIIISDFHKWLRRVSPVFYRKVEQTKKWGIPYILIWRLFNINLKNIKWI